MGKVAARLEVAQVGKVEPWTIELVLAPLLSRQTKILFDWQEDRVDDGCRSLEVDKVLPWIESYLIHQGWEAPLPFKSRSQKESGAMVGGIKDKPWAFEAGVGVRARRMEEESR